MFRILIVGAKGFAKELLPTVIQNEADAEITFYDDVSHDLPELLFDKFQIIRNEKDAGAYLRDVDPRFALGVGNPRQRADLFEKFVNLGGNPTTVISSFAKIGPYANVIGDATCILTDAVVETDNKMGRGCLIHVGAFVSHNVVIGDFCEVSPRVSLLGNVSVGDRCSLGTGCIVLPKVSIGNDVTVGAGAVVTKDVNDGVTVIGIPARER